MRVFRRIFKTSASNLYSYHMQKRKGLRNSWRRNTLPKTFFFFENRIFGHFWQILPPNWWKSGSNNLKLPEIKHLNKFHIKDEDCWKNLKAMVHLQRAFFNKNICIVQVKLSPWNWRHSKILIQKFGVTVFILISDIYGFPLAIWESDKTASNSDILKLSEFLISPGLEVPMIDHSRPIQ